LPLRLYADECVDGRIVAGLRRRGIDVATAADEGLRSATDPQHMERATALGRIVVSADRDFLVIVADQRARGVPFPGLFYILQGTPVGEAIRAIADAAEILDPPEMNNWVEWIP
jgi:hypothetical protein